VIYFLQCAPSGPIKIGFTSGYVGTRVRALQTATPHELVFLGSHAGGREIETELHHQFADYCCRGEWFHPVKPIFDYINEFAEDRDLSVLMREDLRRTVTVANRKSWSKENKAAYAETFGGYLNPYAYMIGRWTGGGYAPPPELVDAVEGFLAERNIRIAEAAE